MYVKSILGFLFLIILNSNAQEFKVKLDKSKLYQTIEGFGASDAWRCEFVGKNWPEKKKEKIAELLFSKALDTNGNPKGIGLSLWRFYIGAGTAEQKEESGIKNEWRRVEAFVNKEGIYNWTKQVGQQWFLNKASKYGVNRFLAFSISAPVQWTKNGKGFNGDNKDGEINLKREYFEDYSQFMIEFLNHFKDEGILFDYVSPINEPQWDWERASQEGTPATNDNILKIIDILDRKIQENNLSTKVVVAEAADLRWLYSDFGKPERGNQIDYFFDKKDSFKNLKSTISGHSYFTTWPLDSLISIRKKLNKKLKKHDLEYWQSEFCILDRSDDIGGGYKRDLGINTALYVARVIHADLTLANASSWQWWTAITRADYKDGLIYIDTGNESDLYNQESLKYDGVARESKLLWALGNYSRFVKPGMRRIEISLNEGGVFLNNTRMLCFLPI
ncbi:glycoside hydrolase [Flavicella sediminum]|uniref:glycoside hydrolase n=1 Tax=Flavicella sediminum TaxID=2585141 RepID=UPI001408CE68|nr:glycoside hydrolase [Flavicella sediminum]